MTIRWPSPYGYTLFCDDLRREEGGKITLVGLYGAEMIIFGSFPVGLPKLALVVTFVERPGESDEPLELVIYFPGDPDDAPTHRFPIKPDILDGFRKQSPEPDAEDPILTLRLDVLLSPALIKQEGHMKVRIIRGNTEIRMGALRVRAQPPATEQVS